MAGTTADTQEMETAETPEGTGYLPPCREAELFIVPCPRCGREMRLKTLRYSHVCVRSFDSAQRALEQQVLADKAVNVRMASLEQHVPHHAEMQRKVERTVTQAPARDYSKLVSFK